MKKVIKKKLPAKKSFAVRIVKTSKTNVWIKVLGIANIVAFLGVLAINYLAVQLPLGGMTTGALSDLYPNLFTPAGLTFSIRGLIYTALLGFVVRQTIDLFKKNSL